MGVTFKAKTREHVERERLSTESQRGPHRISSLFSCEFAWHLRYLEHRFVQLKREAPAKGTMLHAGMEAAVGDVLQAEADNYRPLPMLSGLSTAPATASVSYPVSTMPVPPLEVPTVPGTMTKEQVERALRAHLNEDVGITQDYSASLADGVMFYAQQYSHDEFRPLWVEREFSAKIGSIDPTGTKDGSLPAYVDVPDAQGVVHRRYINDEVVTARLDLVAQQVATGSVWILDYKSIGPQGTSRAEATRGMLYAWNEERNEYKIFWQGLVALLIARNELIRTGFYEPLRGFIVRRLTRQEPWDSSQHVLGMPKNVWREVPRLLRRAVVRELEIERHWRLTGERPLHTGVATGRCFGRYGACDYRPACATDDAAEFEMELTKLCGPAVDKS